MTPEPYIGTQYKVLLPCFFCRAEPRETSLLKYLSKMNLFQIPLSSFFYVKRIGRNYLFLRHPRRSEGGGEKVYGFRRFYP